MTAWTAFDQVTKWQATIAQVRDVLLAGEIGGFDLSQIVRMRPEASDFKLSAAEVDRLGDLCTEAVEAGRLIDFGMLPNAVIRFGGIRGGQLWDAGGLAMPFSEPWVFRHAWEGGVSAYFVNPIAAGEGGLMPHPLTGELVQPEEGYECAELVGYIVDGKKRLCVGDRGRIFKCVAGMPANKLWASMAPSSGRFLADPELFHRINNGKPPAEAAAGNISDPVATALLMLGTRNVERETVHAPAKLQRARLKSGKAPLPSYDVVHSELYVTAIESRGSRRQRGEDQGGTHRSPVPHVRMGHPREYATGRSIFIRDTLVNVPEEQRASFKAQRSHYSVGAR
jgi:hypothetical protein